MNRSDNNNRRDTPNSVENRQTLVRTNGGDGDGDDTNSSNSDDSRSGNSRKNRNSYGRPLFVQHNYHDHANDPKVRGSAHKAKTNRGGIKVPFPMLLHKVLDEVDQEDLSSILSWQPHGRSFLLHKPKKFEQLLMPQYFTQCSKLPSFQRQLNIYGFKQITQGLDRGGYYHEYFLRGWSDLSVFLQRKRIRGTKRRARSSPATEPDFYSMKPLPGPSVVANDSANETDTVEPVMSSVTGASPQQDEGQVKDDDSDPVDFDVDFDDDDNDNDDMEEKQESEPTDLFRPNPMEALSNSSTTMDNATTTNDQMIQTINELDLWSPPQRTSNEDSGCFGDEEGDARSAASSSSSSSSSESSVEIPEWEVSFHEVDTLQALDEMIFEDENVRGDTTSA